MMNSKGIGYTNPFSLIYYNTFRQYSKLEIWKPNGICNDIHGTDGTQFHPNVQRYDHLWTFEPTLCRSFKFVHPEHETPTVRGITTMRFHVADDNFRKTIKNHCFCLEDNQDDCEQGMININLCTGQEVDLIASTPYFMYNPNMRESLSLKAQLPLTVENYGSFLDVEPVRSKDLKI